MAAAVLYLTKILKLKVNQQKSAVDNPWNRQFLGFTFTQGKAPYRIAVHESRSKRLKDKIRGLARKMRGGQLTEIIRKRIMPITRGWANYFGLAEARTIFEDLDGWIRRKIRGTLWRQWKNPRTRYRRLRALGLKVHTANNHAYGNKGPWRMAISPGMHRAVSNGVIESMGYTPMRSIVQARS